MEGAACGNKMSASYICFGAEFSLVWRRTHFLPIQTAAFPFSSVKVPTVQWEQSIGWKFFLSSKMLRCFEEAPGIASQRANGLHFVPEEFCSREGDSPQAPATSPSGASFASSFWGDISRHKIYAYNLKVIILFFPLFSPLLAEGRREC